MTKFVCLDKQREKETAVYLENANGIIRLMASTVDGRRKQIIAEFTEEGTLMLWNIVPEAKEVLGIKTNMAGSILIDYKDNN
jgi:hypothetical protein